MNIKDYIQSNIINSISQAIFTKYGINALQATLLIIECSNILNK